jgi:hypothetical protein
MSEQIDISEFMQSPQTIVKTDENGNIGIVLKDWNVEEDSAYSSDEVKQLIKMLEESVNIMDKYISANQSLPLFESGETDVQQQQTPTQTL